jgi:hypothetical protein
MAKKKAGAKKSVSSNVSSKKSVKKVSKKTSAKNARFQPPPPPPLCAVVVSDSYSLYLSPSSAKVFEVDEPQYLPAITANDDGTYLIETNGRRYDDFAYFISEDGNYDGSKQFRIDPVQGSNCQAAILTLTQRVSARVLGNLVVTVLAKKKPRTNRA